MATPIPTLILDECESRLRNMTTANGYTRTVAGVRRATLKGFQNADLPMANVWHGPDRLFERAGGFMVRALDVLVEVYDQTRDRPFVDVADELALDVCMALHRATTAPRVTDRPEQTLNGLCISMQLDSVAPQIGEGQAPWCGAMVTLTALYRVRNDGYTPATP